ncbi:hypothetical protein [Vibrio alginolyticus]|uniref:hypothetical protein n=1 Tax=Vibrio alginolyticus TaxID=663 RepID=UPI000AA6B5D2|nr:hypothetical protein [Vibrio alginolyticus]MBY7710669.1 hypothetical protein [Vibrio alginolyticus]
MSELKGLQARVSRFGKDEQGNVFFYVDGEDLPFKLDMSMVNLSLIPFIAVGLGVTMNYISQPGHHLVNWWTFVKSPFKDEDGQPVPWASRRIRYRRLSLPLRKA